MSDHEFEKKVQQRMDDLKLRPSEAVWAELEKNLRREKRRRRTLLWLPILGVLLTAGGYLIYSGTGQPVDGSMVNNQSTEKAVAPSVADAQSSASATEPASSSTVKNNESSSKNSTPSNKGEKAATVVAEPTPSIDQPVAPEKNNARVNKNDQPLTVTDRKQPRDKKLNNTSSDGTETVTRDSEPNRTEKNKINSGIKAPKEPAQKIIVIKKDSVKTQIDSNAVVDSRIKPAAPLNIDQSYYAIKIDGNRVFMPVLTNETTIKPPAKKYPVASKWQWGVTAGGGVSNVSEGGLFELLKSVRVEDLTNAGPSYSGIPAAPAPEPSAIEPGTLYTAGAFVQKDVSKRLTLSAGLQYSHWSVNTRVGRRENVVRAVNYSNFDQQLVGYSYRADMGLRDYTNRYHFVELPVMLSYRFNRSRRTPLVLDGGLSLSRLVYTNALHFDGISRVYYENDDFFNKLQAGLNAGLKIGFLQYSKNPIWVGPNLRYFASGLIKSDIAPSGSQHLWSFGINAKMLLKK
jgi:hypothetical protein